MNFFLQLLQLLTFSALCGALWVAQRPIIDEAQPSHPPPPTSENARRPRDVLDDLKQAAIKRSAIFEITEPDLNLHLNRVVSGDTTTVASYVVFEHLYLRLHADEAHAILQWRVFGKPRTVSFTFRIVRLENRFRVTLTGGSYGHLRVPRGLMRPMLPALDSIGQVLSEEIQALFQMNQIQLAEGRLVIDPRFP